MFRILYRVLNKLGLLRFLNFEAPNKVNEVTFLIPLQGGVGGDNLFEKEIWMNLILKRILSLKLNSTFVDVGVNLGQTLLKVKSLSTEIPYVGFEPNAVCVAYIEKLVKVNSLRHVTILPVGISDFDGQSVLYHALDNRTDSSASIVREFRDVSNLAQKVIVTFSSNLLSFIGNSTLGVIKIDVEGAELEVIRNLKPFVERDRPFIICEILPVYSNDNTFRLDRQKQLIDIITSLNYQIHRISKNGDLILLSEIGIHNRIEDSNYLFVPIELTSAIK
ncbi:MAG: FkbM family methyltransferase [Cyclobacteriaceae bacterium]|nr:FkbM family methyltransferase [Cyclobacteriaceae bacterium]